MGLSKQPTPLPVKVLLHQYVRSRDGDAVSANTAIRDARGDLADGSIPRHGGRRQSRTNRVGVLPRPYNQSRSARCSPADVSVSSDTHSITSFAVTTRSPTASGRCVSPGEVYAVAGFGPTFWTAVAKGSRPKRRPALVPDDGGRAAKAVPVAVGGRSFRGTGGRARGHPGARPVLERERRRRLPRTGRPDDRSGVAADPDDRPGRVGVGAGAAGNRRRPPASPVAPPVA